MRLSDFGLATYVAATRAGFFVGTPAYMAPEVLRGEAATVRSDQYGIAAIVYETLAGKLPYSPEAIQRWTSGRSLRPPVMPAALPTHVAEALERALDPSPAGRFESVASFMKALEAQPRQRRSGTGVALLVGAAALVVVAVAIGWKQSYEAKVSSSSRSCDLRTTPCGPHEYCGFALNNACGHGGAWGACWPAPGTCTDLDSPVCGCDGRTYQNQCLAHRAGTSVGQLHPCGSQSP